MNLLFCPSSNPTPEGDLNGLDLPSFPKWSLRSPKYMAFRKEGGVIEENYRHTYNAVMLAANPVTEEPEQPTTPAGSSNGSWALQSSLYVVLCACAFAKLLRL